MSNKEYFQTGFWVMMVGIFLLTTEKITMHHSYTMPIPLIGMASFLYGIIRQIIKVTKEFPYNKKP